MANGTINSIAPKGSIWTVDITIPTKTMGDINLRVDVSGPTDQAAAQARQKLYDLGVELAHSFEHPSSLV